MVTYSYGDMNKNITTTTTTHSRMLHDWNPYQSELQQQIEELSSKCGIPSSENIKYSLMVPNGAL